MSNILETAVEAAGAYKWRVFPVQGKRPAGGFGWKYGASQIEEVIRAMPQWAEADAYGVALDPGVVVLDLDVDAQGTLQTALETLRQTHSGLSGAALGALENRRWSPPAVRTPRGGVHLFFATDPLGQWRQTKIGDCVDLRAGGLGYVVGVGSPGYSWLVHPDHARTDTPFLYLRGAVIG